MLGPIAIVMLATAAVGTHPISSMFGIDSCSRNSGPSYHQISTSHRRPTTPDRTSLPDTGLALTADGVATGGAIGPMALHAPPAIVAVPILPETPSGR